MLPIQCEDCVYANWDYTLFRDNCASYDYVNKRLIPPYREQFDFYCNKHKRFYLEEEITGNCRDGVYGPNNYSEICNKYYKERAEYIESLKRGNEMTQKELEIAQAACCVGTMWDQYEGTEEFNEMVGKRVQHLIELVRNYLEQKQPEANKIEKALSLQIQAYLTTASDELYAPGKPLYTKEHHEGIHECMKMWQKLHRYYFSTKQKPAEWSEKDSHE